MRNNGKYDIEIKDTLDKITQLHEVDFSIAEKMQEKFNCIKSYYTEIITFEELHLILNRLKNENNHFLYAIEDCLKKYNNSFTKFDIINASIFIGKSALSLLCKITNLSSMKIKETAYSLYLKKNEEYGDGWYAIGSIGLFYDLHRKAYRLKKLINSELDLIHNSVLEDTLLDTLNYSVFFIVSLTVIENNNYVQLEF